MKLTILITGSAPLYVARVISERDSSGSFQFLGSDLLMEGKKKTRCANIDRAQQEARYKLERSWRNIPLTLTWEVQQP